MGSLTFSLPESFLLKISALGNKTDDIIPKILEAGGEVILAKVKNNLQAVVGKNTKYESRSTGELINSLGMSPAKQDRNGNYNLKIGFSDPRKGGNSNALIAGTIEYGKQGQPAKPFMKPARTQSKNAAINAMISKFDEEVKKL